MNSGEPTERQLTVVRQLRGAIVKRERCSRRKVNMAISLAFLAPTLIRTAIEGRLPRGVGATRLSNLPAE